MDIKDLQNRLKRLDILYSKVNFSKMSILQQIGAIRNSFTDAYNQAVLTKEIFSHIKSKYGYSSYFYDGDVNNKKLLPTLWVYFAAKKSLLSISNDVLEEMLIDGKKENDLVMPIGKEAIDFCEIQKYNIPLTFNDKTAEYENIVFAILELFQSKRIGEIKILIHSTKVANSPITILPLVKFEVQNKIEIFDKKINYHYYPDLTNILEKLFHSFVSQIIKSLSVESNVYILKQKLIKHKSSETSIDQKREDIRKQISKIKYDQLTNDIILLTSIKKQLNKNRRANSDWD